MPNGVLVPPLSRPLVLPAQPANSAAEERYRHQDKMMQNLMHSQQHILGILHIRVSYLLNLSNSI
jgi:hypothetical protein